MTYMVKFEVPQSTTPTEFGSAVGFSFMTLAGARFIARKQGSQAVQRFERKDKAEGPILGEL